MRTSMKYEVDRDMMGNVANKGLVLEVTLNKKESEQDLYDYLNNLSEYTGINFKGGILEENCYCFGWLEMDREEFAEIKEEYMDHKKEYKSKSKVKANNQNTDLNLNFEGDDDIFEDVAILHDTSAMREYDSYMIAYEKRIEEKEKIEGRSL